jgi:hypothetical protein
MRAWIILCRLADGTLRPVPQIGPGGVLDLTKPQAMPTREGAEWLARRLHLVADRYSIVAIDRPEEPGEKEWLTEDELIAEVRKAEPGFGRADLHKMVKAGLIDPPNIVHPAPKRRQ